MRKTATVFCSLLLTFALPGHSAGELYKCKGENGETVFSDQPCPGGETLPMRETPTYAAPATPKLPVGETAATSKKKPEQTYQVQITEPAVDAVLRDNEGKVSVSASIAPSLDEDHRVQLLLDGSVVGLPGRASSWELTDVERGEHSVRVEVIHKAGKLLGSAQSKFMLFRASANHNPDGAGNLQIRATSNGYLQQVHWPQLQDARQPGDPVPTTPTKPVTNGPRK
ncbi:MAG: DUF4124 domain-containing protein [Permianibacter sp.]